MIAVGPLDHPDARKLHVTPVPRGGGLGIVAAFLLGMELLAGTGMVAEGYFRGVMLAATLLAGIGWLDDLRGLPFGVKLATQVLAAALVAASGVVLPITGHPWLAAAATVGWLVFVTNAMNFIDGMNGLAAGVVLVAASFLALGGGLSGFVPLAAGLLAAGTLGFLPFNFPRAWIFLGDVGSQFCGFVLGVLGVAATGRSGIALVPLLLSGVLWDVGFTLVRRAIAGENLAQAHRGHLYQLAQRGGMDVRLVALLHAGFAVLGGFAAWRLLAGQLGWLLVPALTQLGWTALVLHRARRTNLGQW